MFQANLGRGPALGAKRQNPGTLGDKISKKPSVKQKVKPFTKESLERLENKTIQLVRDYGFQPKRKLSVEDGSVLPNKFEPFPTNLYGVPLEEIDNFIYDETFCVVSKRFRKNYIHRFSANRSFFIFSPWNPVRQTCIFLSTNQYFDYVVMITILLNCVFLAMTEPVEEAEFVFLAIYTAETIIKSVAKGFILNKYTYLRNPWNWLDFVVITSGYATIGMEVGNLAGLRTFRVLRALKTVSIMPGLKTIINALLHSFRQLAEVMTLTIFCLMVFALFALQVYMGELRNKCIRINDNATEGEWLKSVWNEENWLKNEDYKPIVCGNATGARHCPNGYICLRVGENPNYGFTNFDNFLWSMLTTFQLITLDYWENVYNMVISVSGPVSVIFFTVVVFFGSFYLINLMLAVVALSYEEEAEITLEERRKDLVDHRDDSTFSFDPSNLEVKQLDKNCKKKIDAKKGILLSSYTRKKTKRKRARAKEASRENSKLKTESESKNQKQKSSSICTSNQKNNSSEKVLTESKLLGPPTSIGPTDPKTEIPVKYCSSQLALDSMKQESGIKNEGKTTFEERKLNEFSSDYSNVINDHEEGVNVALTEKTESVTIAVRTQEKEIRILKCNGISAGQDPKKLLKEHLYSLPPDYLSHIVVLEDLIDRNCKSCMTCCIDYDGWLRFQNFLYKVVKDPLFELLITICIILNTMFLAMEHHGMSESVRQALDIGNKIFTSIFTLECFLKLLALSKEYFDCGWNIFDLIIVSASLLDLSIEILDGLTVLRGLRLLRVLKLAQSWTTMKVLLSIIISTIGALGNLTFVLVIVIYIFAVIGMQLFSKDYTFEKFAPDPVPRWNFNDFFHSFMMIFRILCGEWIEPLWDCMRAEAVEGGTKTCFFIFLPALVMGNFMVLNLFLALLLNSFNSEELKNKKEEVGEESKLTKSFERLRSIIGKKKKNKEFEMGTEKSFLEKSNEEIVQKKDVELKIFDEGTKLQRGEEDSDKNASISESIPQTEKSLKPKGSAFDKDSEISPLKDGLFSTSQDFGDQLREMFNEKISSLHANKDDIFIVASPTEKNILFNSGNENHLSFSPQMVSSSQTKADSNFVSRIPDNHDTAISPLHLTCYSPRSPQSESITKKFFSENLNNTPNSSLRQKRIFPETKGNEDFLNTNDRTISFSDSQTLCSNTNILSEKTIFSKQINYSNDCLKRQSSIHKHLCNDSKSSVDSMSNTRHRLSEPDEKPIKVENYPESDGQSDTSQGNSKVQKFQSAASSPERLKFLDAAEESDFQPRNKRLSYFLAIEEGDKKEPTTNKEFIVEEIQSNKKKEMVKATTDEEKITEGDICKKPWHTLMSYVDELTIGRRRGVQSNYIDAYGEFPGFIRKKKSKNPQDCFPYHCYQRSDCCNHIVKTNLGRKWMNCRKSVLSVVDTPAFEWLILVLIFSSSITLCFEDIYLDNNPVLKNILYWTNFGFCALFSFEMLLKWIALGFWKYFTSFWTILDFVIVFVSIFSLLIEENENLKVLRSLRTLRALRPLRAISRWQGMRIVVNALMYAIPSIFNVLLVCLVFWLIFSIMGVQFFGGKFFKCLDENGELLPISVVNDKFECLYKNYTWINSKITFDHVGQAYLALFQVATFEGWMEVMADAVDARGEDLQPQREANLYAYLYFVIFIVCGSFFTLNLFIGVIIDNFNMLKKKYEGGVLEMFLTESQKHYYTAMKKLGRKKPQKVIHRPLNQFLAMFYDLSNSRRFEIAIFILIFLNMVTMAIEHYDQPRTIFFVLEVSNAFFTTVFGLEAMVKIIGLRHHYFIVPWNVFDFFLVLASILGILMEDIMIDFPVSPTLLRVVRVFRIGRILRLIKAAKGIRKLLFALVVSLPALFNIGALLSLITFIYAIIGMSVFGHVKQQGALDDVVNFETFGKSMQLLFRLMTSAGWNDVLESLMIQPPNCNPLKHSSPNGDCGYPLLAITYFTSFIIINYMIVINMYIAIILENFNQAHQEEEIGIVEDDLEMFYIRWSKYDPHATQFIRFNQLSDFIASLDPPLGISKPNIVALVSFNLPIARGNKIHCLDILHALVKHVLGHVEETDDFKKLQDQMDIKFKKQFPTRKELEIVSSTRIWKRQDKAARLIQKSYLEYAKRKKEKENAAEDLEDEVTQTSSPGGWQGRLSSFLHVHRGSRVSSRKSSRASDASDLSELGGPWLNLPLLLLGGTNIQQQDNSKVKGAKLEGGKANKSQDNNDCKHYQNWTLSPQSLSRRKSFSIFQRRGSAREKKTGLFTPEPLRRRSFKERSWRSRESLPSESNKEKPKETSIADANSKSFILNEITGSTKINILLTQSSIQLSPEETPTFDYSSISPCFQTNESKKIDIDRRRVNLQEPDKTVVQVLVHKEFEEYTQEDQES